MQETRLSDVDVNELARNQRLVNSRTVRTEGATRKQIDKAISDKRNFKVSVYRPGAIVEQKGRKFRVAKSGKLIAI